MNKIKSFLSYIISKKSQWLPSFIIIILIFLILIFIGKINPIIFSYN